MANQLVKDLMFPFDMLEVSIDDDASTASEQVLNEGRSAVVAAPGHHPVAILSRRSSRRLLHLPGALKEHPQELTITGLTTLNYPVADLIKSIAFREDIDAFIVMEGNLRKGIVPVRALFEEIRRLGWSHTNFVDPPKPVKSCYCCPAQPSHSAHQVPSGQAKYDPATRQYYCATHMDYLIYEDPCLGC